MKLKTQKQCRVTLLTLPFYKTSSLFFPCSTFFFLFLQLKSFITPIRASFFFCLPRSIPLFKLDRFFSWMIFLRGPMTVTSYSFLFISPIMECRKQRIPLISLVKSKKKRKKITKWNYIFNQIRIKTFCKFYFVIEKLFI